MENENFKMFTIEFFEHFRKRGLISQKKSTAVVSVLFHAKRCVFSTNISIFWSISSLVFNNTERFIAFLRPILKYYQSVVLFTNIGRFFLIFSIKRIGERRSFLQEFLTIQKSIKNGIAF